MGMNDDLPSLPVQRPTALVIGGPGGSEYRMLSDEWCETTAKYSAVQMREYALAAVAEAQRAAVPQKVRWTSSEGETFAEMVRAVRRTPLYQIGDTILVWVNEGDIHLLGQRVGIGKESA